MGAPEAVRIFFFRIEEYVVFAGIRTLDRSAVASELFHHLLQTNSLELQSLTQENAIDLHGVTRVL